MRSIDRHLVVGSVGIGRGGSIFFADAGVATGIGDKPRVTGEDDARALLASCCAGILNLGAVLPEIGVSTCNQIKSSPNEDMRQDEDGARSDEVR
jgi:hypothetical protein